MYVVRDSIRTKNYNYAEGAETERYLIKRPWLKRSRAYAAPSCPSFPSQTEGTAHWRTAGTPRNTGARPTSMVPRIGRFRETGSRTEVTKGSGKVEREMDYS